MKNFDLVVAGVGGQGIILASRVISNAAIAAGMEIRTSEVLGMAQREGPVTSQVRMGKNLQGALIPAGQADALLGFELSETVRNLYLLKPGGTVVTSTTTIVPTTVALGLSTYNREELMAHLRQTVSALVTVDTERLAREAGNVKALNSVLLGTLAALEKLPIPAAALRETLLSIVPPKLQEVNERAFDLGYRSIGVS
ncbi:MAG: indolepyruvate oxidoreductase subunit beta [Eubacteriales bacterium]|jgi:indolepyruvate ferredoxin oxidoreductase beta subunit|nr:indolepyruvate oxidoreductase subunit beta [Bacillota bacterium]MBV1726432.1 indolepyruvate oxidoreductase subunit beta [Desulforudis sp.]MDP3051310.1 indolepyruvate oxidoreductase subunit beta [Eubacteriales bacterium]MDQ7789594.1 indolepyruvate oxidoreductase subunit beta [Clostridia bacterium]MBU4532226.1 indolepyruvate oxidoreductase subunit beta [Bacillota bacterium]